ncbi:MAG: rhomboid family intramembrane serine protease [Treponema sp.]|jgi:membrane associated rhomboid family serine protease|nr:rhomboid family intramembrane serine protease [Treponema sp.]
MKLKYNSPTILTFTFISAAVLALNQFLMPNFINQWFMVPGHGDFHFGVRNIVNLFTHVIGHADWSHLVNNFSIILLVGPMLEMRYGSKDMILMMATTALATGLLNVVFFTTGLLGASGIVFMMILLASFTNFKKGEIPLTFILVLFLYLGQQLLEVFQSDNISQFAHIAGGVLGSLFGFLGRGESSE